MSIFVFAAHNFYTGLVDVMIIVLPSKTSPGNGDSPVVIKLSWGHRQPFGSVDETQAYVVKAE